MFNYSEFLCAVDIRELFNAINDWTDQWSSLDYDRSDFKEFLNTKLNLTTTTSMGSITIIWHDMFEFLVTNSKLQSLSLDIEAINTCSPITDHDNVIVNLLI